MAKILGIETSCDECSAAVVETISAGSGNFSNLKTLGLSTFSQDQIHQPYGGVVPEIASRNHLETVNTVIEASLKEAGIKIDDVDAIAVTSRPGLVGALLVGVSAAKALAYAHDKPLVSIHHLEGHAASVFLENETLFQLPLLLAIVSGGHTNLHVIRDYPKNWSDDFLKESLVGKSRDDAAGEAFDKTAKILGLPYPGGIWIERKSEDGDPNAFKLPRALPQKSVLDYSFSGLKTAVSILTERLKAEGTFEKSHADICASTQEAIVDALVSKFNLAIKKYGCKSLAVVGGVAANRRLRKKISNLENIKVMFPKLKYCTDNAAMIAAAGGFRFEQGKALSQSELLKLNAVARAGL